ncbi:methyltransferase domain-containing protein [Altererythrobacter endophyticus]|uniref:Methyltransferase domain-containing protein n=2 Tax=Altericroceibacterium endophyticum TaxID=1808508 RepID=A0A6I4T586_9SPHN|nr:methyltransferase domain-containing protein [Altericroceibacterium endophyticum]MXO65311.1 methyltransferase domain-containing protein [Altericroceibacterium endophyticum]
MEARALYDNIATRYDRLLFGFRLVGIGREREALINELGLKTGNTVIDLCCGTGKNFESILKVIGASGSIIGVDLSRGMLSKARRKAERAGWSNVELIEADVEAWDIPSDVDAVVSTFSLEMVPQYAQVIERTSAALRPGGRLGLLGLKYPNRWPKWLITAGIWLTQRFGASADYADFKPWEAAAEHFDIISFRQLLAGAAYRCVAAQTSEKVRMPDGS